MLTACSGDGTNPFDNTDTDTGDGSTGGESGIPASLTKDLDGINYNAADNTLTVTGITLTSGQATATYDRNAALDTAGYHAYTTQDDELDRHSIALVQQSGNSGSVRAGAVSTGGQFNRFFYGGYYERDGNFTPPTSGQVSYAGTYAGLTNLQVGGDLIPVTPGTPVELMPGQAARTEGNIFLNVTFGENNNAINGSVYDRSIVDTGQALPSIVLVATDIAADGTFLGQVEYDGILNNNIGDYGGIFGGPNAESVAGVVSLEEFDNDTLGFDNELEIGVFVLDQCGTPDAIDPLCANVNP